MQEIKKPLISQLDPELQPLGLKGKLIRTESWNELRALSHALSHVGFGLDDIRIPQGLLARPLTGPELRVWNGNDTLPNLMVRCFVNRMLMWPLKCSQPKLFFPYHLIDYCLHCSGMGDLQPRDHGSSLGGAKAHSTGQDGSCHICIRSRCCKPWRFTFFGLQQAQCDDWAAMGPLPSMLERH